MKISRSGKHKKKDKAKKKRVLLQKISHIAFMPYLEFKNKKDSATLMIAAMDFYKLSK